MHLKLGKQFSLIKFKPNILQQLKINFNLLKENKFNINDPITNFNDLVNIDFVLAQSIRETKLGVKQYIDSINQAMVNQVIKNRQYIKECLQNLVDIIQKLNLENLQRNIKQLFKGQFGLYSLYKYVWSPDILHLINKIKTCFLQKQSKDVDDPQMLMYSRRGTRYCQQIEDVMQKQAKKLVKQFVSEMYIIPENWGQRLAKQSKSQLSQKITNVFESDCGKERLGKLLAIYRDKQTKETKQFKSIVLALFYNEIQTQFYFYLTFIKGILLNRVSGIFTGEYEVWEKIYDVCIKIYARKENVRGKKGIEIDQLLEQQIQDQQFTQFLLKSNPQSYQLCSVLFYFKNCPISVKDNLKTVIMIKIKTMLQSFYFQQFEDIIEYLEMQASNDEKNEILKWISKSLQQSMEKGIKKEELFQIRKGITNLLEYLLKYDQKFFDVINQNLVQKMLDQVNKQQLLIENKNHKVLISFISSFVNQILNQAYEEQFEIEKYLCENKKTINMIEQIVIKLKTKYKFQIHENGLTVLLDWKHMMSQNDSFENEEKNEEGRNIYEIEWGEMIGTLMLISGKDCDFKLESCFSSEEQKEVIANQITKLFQMLSDAQFAQRKQIQNLFKLKSARKLTEEQKILAQSYLLVKGFKDRLLHENVLNLVLKLHPVLAFSQIAHFSAQFLTFMAPTVIDQPLSVGLNHEYGSIEPFDVYDVVSGEEPIECMKLIYKKIPQFEENMLEQTCFDRLPVQLIQQLGKFSYNRHQLARQLVQMEGQLQISVVDKVQQFKKLLFYVQLMTKVFNKLNQKSQRGIKQIRVIYTAFQKICLKISNLIISKVLSSQVYSLCQQNISYTLKINEMMSYSQLSSHQNKQLPKEVVDFSHNMFNKLLTHTKLPFVNILLKEKNYMTKICQQLICSIGKVLTPQTLKSQYQKLYNPLQIIRIETLPQQTSQSFLKTYQIIGQVVKVLAMVEFTCNSEEKDDKFDKQEHKKWSSRWRKNCINLTGELLEKIDKWDVESRKNEKGDELRDVWVNVFLIHVKTVVIKILVPFIIKDTLKYPQEDKNNYSIQLQQTFSSFFNVCRIVQKIAPGEEQHLMTFLQIFESYDLKLIKSIQNNDKTSQFLYKAIEVLLQLVFKRIRVRSYHFYKFIRIYLKLTKEKERYLFFNSVISYHVNNLIQQIVPQFQLPSTILNYCDSNMNDSLRVVKNGGINEYSQKQEVNKMRFINLTKFEQKFNLTAEKVCVISMFINLFCRLNFKSLNQGIEKIWESKDMHLIYIQYLKQITILVSEQLKSTDKKLLDIINVDCFGNLEVVLKEWFNQKKNKSKRSKQDEEYKHQIIYELLKLVKEVLKNNISQYAKNSLLLPVKKVMNQIRSSSTSVQTIDYITESISKLRLSMQQPQKQEISGSRQILNMIITCYNTKLAKGISSNVHINNITYICQNSQMKTRIFEHNMNSLEKRMGRRDIKIALKNYNKKVQNSNPQGSGNGKKSNLVNKVKPEEIINGQEKQCYIDTWIKVSRQSENLMKKIIENFIKSYRNVNKNELNSVQTNQKVLTLLNNLKILTVVALNNPELIMYMMEYRCTQHNLTVYEVLIETVCTSLQIFAQLYLTFLKINIGFVYVGDEGNKRIMPYNFSIETKIKNEILCKLARLLLDQNSNKEQLEGLLKTCEFITKIANSSYKPNLRIYKFGNIVNLSYNQAMPKYQTHFFKKLCLILKKGILKINCTESSMVNNLKIRILELYEQVLNKILKESDMAWMKLNLDFQLKQLLNNQNSPSSYLLNEEQGLIQKLLDAEKEQITYIQNKVEHSSEQCTRQTQFSISYNFETQVISEQIYSILQKLEKKFNARESSLQFLQKMMEYSEKQSKWEDIPEESTILLHYPNNESSAGNFGGIGSINDLNNCNGIQSNINDLIGVHLDDCIIQSGCISQVDSIVDDRHESSHIVEIRYDCIVENDESLQIIPISLRTPSNEISQFQHSYGIIQEEEGNMDINGEEDSLLSVDQLKECMSETSLKFLSQHSVHIIEEKQEKPEHVNKLQLLELYEQSAINPEARKQLLMAINQSDSAELQKFISNEAVDEEVEMIVIRELWSRGVIPSATSICRNNKYYSNLLIDQHSNKASNLYVNEAIVYKRMYDQYQKKIQINPTNAYIALIPKSSLQQNIICCFLADKNSDSDKSSESGLWKIANKLALQPLNCYNLIEISLQYLASSDAQINQRISSRIGQSNKTSISAFKQYLIDDLLAGCIKDKVGLNLILTGFWDGKNNKIQPSEKVSQIYDNSAQNKQSIPILQFILNETNLIEELMSASIRNKQLGVKTVDSDGMVNVLWDYLCKCDEFKMHSKQCKSEQFNYPYYQIQQTIKVSQSMVIRMVQRLFAQRKVICGDGEESSLMQKLFMTLIYLDPTCFQLYFGTVIQKISTKLSQIIKKQQKILANFLSFWNSSAEKESIFLEMQKEEKYWNFRQSKKSMRDHEENLGFFRNMLLDIGINLLPKFKKIRFNFHCGKNYREWKLQIEILKEKLLSFGNIEGLGKLEEKERELEEWRRNQSNKVINQEIIPIVEEHFSRSQFLNVLSQAEGFISEFLDTFKLKDQTQKIVIYNTCAKLYEMLLISEILTHEQKVTYHSMSKLKTVQSIESLKNVGRNGRRRSSLLGRKGARISIGVIIIPRVEIMLAKIGPSCTYLSVYLGQEKELRELHAKYSDVNKRLKVLWGTREEQGNAEKTQKQKIIECRRDHILQDTLAQIDEDFINLPVKVKFQGEIGVDYGGVTRQWVTLFMKEIINPDLGLFSLSANKFTFQPNRNSEIIPNHLRYFKKIGMLVGKAMKENWLLEINLTKSFLKHILGSTLYVEDLQDIDPETVKSLKWILDNDIGYDDELGLCFMYENEKLGKKQIIQLIPGGSIIPVTEENKKKYVKLVANFKMTEEIRDQTKAFMNGLQAVIPYSTLSLFSYKQISLYLSGMPQIDIAQMKLSARYENFTSESKQIIWFWSILYSWNQSQLANFLFFLTGSYKVPYGGFKQHPIGFNRLVSCCDYLPVAHTCFNVVDLSEYTSQEKMNRLLKKSIQEGKGFSVS